MKKAIIIAALLSSAAVAVAFIAVYATAILNAD
jgi:hypothetical protein